MDLKLLIFFLAFVFFFLNFNPFFPYYQSITDYLNISGFVSGSYIIIFLLFLLIKNYDEIKNNLNNIQYKFTSFLVLKNTNYKKDLLKFFILSIIITFLIDVIFTKVSQQSFIEYALKYVPGLAETTDLISFSPTNINFTSSDNSLNLSNYDLKFGKIKDALMLIIGPSIGALILFFLRQLSYRSKLINNNNGIHKTPGATILLLFLIISSIALISDIYRDISDGIFQLEDFSADDPNSFETYDLKKTLEFLGYIINIPLFISIIAIWTFDWYLFSRVWERI